MRGEGGWKEKGLWCLDAMQRVARHGFLEVGIALGERVGDGKGGDGAVMRIERGEQSVDDRGAEERPGGVMDEHARDRVRRPGGGRGRCVVRVVR